MTVGLTLRPGLKGAESVAALADPMPLISSAQMASVRRASEEIRIDRGVPLQINGRLFSSLSELKIPRSSAP